MDVIYFRRIRGNRFIVTAPNIFKTVTFTGARTRDSVATGYDRMDQSMRNYYYHFT